jgi:hypothetical protein
MSVASRPFNDTAFAPTPTPPREGNYRRSDFLKLVAIVAMFFDHFGQIFFPYLATFRIIGRIALPIFAFGVAEGYRHTSDLKSYFNRLILLGLISQVPYSYLFETYDLNILFTLAISVGLIYVYDKKKYQYFVLILLASFFAPVDYGIYGVILPFLFFIFKDEKIKLLLSTSLIFILNTVNMVVSNFHIIGVLLILYWPQKLIKIRLPKFFFYWFYFLHIIFLLIARILLLHN